jgi:hypothetical protein
MVPVWASASPQRRRFAILTMQPASIAQSTATLRLATPSLLMTTTPAPNGSCVECGEARGNGSGMARSLGAAPLQRRTRQYLPKFRPPGWCPSFLKPSRSLKKSPGLISDGATRFRRGQNANVRRRGLKRRPSRHAFSRTQTVSAANVQHLARNSWVAP